MTDMQWEDPQSSAPVKKITLNEALHVLYGISARGYLDSPKVPAPQSKEIESIVSAVFHATLTLEARSMIIKDLKSELTDALAQVKYLTTQRDSVFDEMKRLESELEVAKAEVARLREFTGGGA